jgi:pyruvate carboxylase subunit B
MAGIGRPASIGKIVKGIKQRHPDLLVQYHGHATPGFSVASSLEAARAGADIIDVGMEPLSWGTGHADLLTIHAMLKDAGFSIPDVNMEAYMETMRLSQEFIDDFLGHYINLKNRLTNSILIGSGLPGGMMGSLMSDLEKNLKSLNTWLEKRGKEPLTQDRLLLMLFQEVEYVWPRLGYPPLVTPFSQYVKNLALMNVIQTIKGRGRWTMIDENTWSMILGETGKLPGEIGIDLIELAKEQDREFYDGVPQDLYPDELELFAGKMDKKGWDYGPDHEELFEYAMHPQQYEDYKSGKAKESFEEDLKARIEKKQAAVSPAAPTVKKDEKPREFVIKVEGESYHVTVDYPEESSVKTGKADSGSGQTQPGSNGSPGAFVHINAPLEGTFYLTKESNERPVQIGDVVNEGDTVAYIESMKVINAITADKKGRVVEIPVNNGEDVDEDAVILKLAPL